MLEEPTTPESTKQRALRIRMDHYLRPDALQQAKWLLAILATLATVFYTAWICWASPEPNKAFSPGSVANVHAAWDSKCSACHANFTPIRSDALFANSPAHRQAVEAKCTACHAGATHHAIISANEKSCTTCHREHQGGHASLLMMDDSHCTRCHANLKAVNADTPKTTFHEHLTAFYSAEIKTDDPKTWPHPKFRSLDKDPGNIKFNHAIHMTAGLPGTVKNGRTIMTYKQLHEISPSAFRALVSESEKFVNDANPLQLACASCHQADAVDRAIALGGKKGDANLPAPSDGAYMQPISFEQHCKACHPLNLDEQPTHFAPHGVAPAELKAAVFNLLTSDAVPELPANTKEKLQQKLLGKPDPLIAETPTTALEKFAQIEDVLTNVRCKKCHEFEQAGKAFSAKVEPSNIPAHWLKHAKFNHAPHRMVKCVDCHAGADAATRSPDDKTRDDERVMIPNYETCVQCHRPAQATQNVDAKFANFVGARSDCVECHTYHAGDHPRTGPGGKLHAPSESSTTKVSTNQP